MLRWRYLARVSFLESLLPTTAQLKDEFNTLRLGANDLQQLYKDIAAKCDETKLWTGSISGSRGAYPNVLRRCSFGNEDRATGKRRTNAVMFTCSHVVLVAHGHLPFNYGVHASHLCHNTVCAVWHQSSALGAATCQRSQKPMYRSTFACICGQTASLPTICTQENGVRE